MRSHKLSGAPLADPAVSCTIALALPMNQPTGRHVRHTIELLIQETRRAIEFSAWLKGRWLGN